MAFSEEYLSACVALRRRLQAKEVWVGDWYIVPAKGEGEYEEDIVVGLAAGELKGSWP